MSYFPTFLHPSFPMARAISKFPLISYLYLYTYLKTVLQMPEMSEIEVGTLHGPCECQRITNNSACLDPIMKWKMVFLMEPLSGGY